MIFRCTGNRLSACCLVLNIEYTGSWHKSVYSMA